MTRGVAGVYLKREFLVVSWVELILDEPLVGGLAPDDDGGTRKPLAVTIIPNKATKPATILNQRQRE